MTGHRDMKFAGRLVAVAVAMAMLASPAWAQTVGSQQPAPLQTRKSMSAIVAGEAEQGHAQRLQQSAGTSGSQRLKRPKSTRGAVAARVALGGFLVGGYFGAKLTPDCMRGFVIGASAGAIGAGLVSWKLSGR